MSYDHLGGVSRALTKCLYRSWDEGIRLESIHDSNVIPLFLYVMIRKENRN